MNTQGLTDAERQELLDIVAGVINLHDAEPGVANVEAVKEILRSVKGKPHGMRVLKLLVIDLQTCCHNGSAP